MKVTRNDKPLPASFVPFSLEIEFERREEAEAFHSVFNHTAITDWIARWTSTFLDDDLIRRAIDKGDYSFGEKAHASMDTFLLERMKKRT